ncbi:E3 ubiquitin-protein ligase bre1 [Coemansia sp. RSA 2598]|nr:E3 ubiquitin-protein ligase bre1 [Coemansia sp. RSA 2598]
MTERKRRSEDGKDMDSQQQQPPLSLSKKRNTAKDEDFKSLTAEFDQNAAMLDLEGIREFQKEAIWRQMQEYKRDALRAQQQTQSFERRQSLWVEQINRICHLWETAIHDLDAIVNGSDGGNSNNHNPSTSIAPEQCNPQQAWLELFLPTNIPLSPQSSADRTDDVVSAMAGSSELAKANLERFNASVQNVLRQLSAKGSGEPIDWPSAVDRLTRLRVSQSEIDELKSKVALMSRQLSEKRELLEQRESELRRALKSLDRSICPTVRRSDATAAMAEPATASEPGSSSPANKEALVGDEADNQASQTGQPTSNGVPPSAANKAQGHQDKTDYKLLAERRLAEIEAKIHENTQLISQVDALKLQIANVPDHIVAETVLYKQALSSREYYSMQAQRLQAEVERLFAEIAQLKASRAEFEESILTESTSQRQSLEAEMQRLQNDLVRVRHHRDQIQRELEERRAQDAVEDQKSSELKLLSDVRRERMNALISENKRLLTYISVLKGDRAAFETYTDEELSKTTAVADELRAKLEQAVRREKKLSSQLEVLSANGSSDEARVASPSQASPGSDSALRLAAELQTLRQEADMLQARVRKYEEVLGGVWVDEKGQLIQGAESTKSNELVAKQAKLDALMLERDSLLKTSDMMERELQTICESFAKLEEQNTSKVWDLSLKEQAIARVVAEKCKYEEKFIGLNKDREAQRQSNQALRLQNAKQLEHIKVIEERDRMLSHQLSLAGNEAQQATLAWQTTLAKLQESQQRTQELEEQAKVLEERARIAAAALNDRTESLGAMEHEKNRIQEMLDLANRQISEAEKINNQSDLAEMYASYKALLKCPTCQVRFKSHVLTRCMHVFCKECIDSRIETRQRKCPSCSEPFGAKDVRQIYL